MDRLVTFAAVPKPSRWFHLLHLHEVCREIVEVDAVNTHKATPTLAQQLHLLRKADHLRVLGTRTEYHGNFRTFPLCKHSSATFTLLVTSVAMSLSIDNPQVIEGVFNDRHHLLSAHLLSAQAKINQRVRLLHVKLVEQLLVVE